MIKLGSNVTDSITGYTGVATARCEYLFSTPQVQITTNDRHEGKTIDPEWFDEQRIGVNAEPVA